MASWSADYGKSLLKPENKEALDAIAEYFVGQAIEADQDSRIFEPREFDSDLAKKGGKILDDASNGEGPLADAGSCFDCHARTKDEEGSGYPTLVNYGSAEWLKSFISNPGADRHYGSKNKMPAYEGKLTERELDLLVRWLTGDYAPTELDLDQLHAQEPALAKENRSEPAQPPKSPTAKTE